MDWNEWNGLMWNGVIGDPNCGMNDMNVVALWCNCMSNTELIVFDCDIGFDERIRIIWVNDWKNVIIDMFVVVMIVWK